MKIFNKDEILARLDLERAEALLRQGFIAYSAGRTQLPPVQHFAFAAANGDCCVKSGYVEGESLFAVKVSSGFYDNSKRGLPSNQGLVLCFCAHTGAPLALLRDEGWLTAWRTALAGRLAARVLAPRRVEAIGIVGTGLQARLQLRALQAVTPCREAWVWGRSEAALAAFAAEFEPLGYRLRTTLDAEPLARACRLIVSCTPSTRPILQAGWLRPGTHVTAVGADAAGKQELAAELVAGADRIVVDSVAQCAAYGEASHALAAGLLDRERLAELGQVLAGERPGRQSEDEITLADLTGLAVQDAQIAKCVLEAQA
ncbi:ornithine cyclodeaminase family protein [Chromobacterium haemolyticum]|uniref:ornithine cyclodeaminase family protein n=1 Tax=Chromobacterium haemolyticum TaxID=394935 RepID=UPI0009D96158|nr:ornithine cyclodeaminase family protein [Chromobacterium haemolyticum]OQS42910.1 ornithine cyclodeaminase family protein [Chromobacterium haemolyticum]